MAVGKLHSYETFAAADGPGVRFLVFTSGCPFRCLYCHNPDTWGTPPAFEATADEVLRHALRYRSYWREEGGITVSGGEPMLQAEFVAELFEKAHEAGVNTCIDTAAGIFSREPATFPRFERLLDATDTVLLDIKHIVPEKHRKLTGRDNAPVLDCARYLAEIGKATWIRYVLVPGYTDGAEDLAKLGDFLRTLPNVRRLDILPYHVFGAEKWKRLAIPYALENVEPPSPEAVARAREIIGDIHS